MSSISRKVVEWIAKHILEKHLTAGDVLPSEATISAQLSVGRSSVREAFATLKAFGIAQSKPGVGLVLESDHRRLDLMALFTREHFERADYKAVKELRDFVEIGAVDAMINNVTTKQIEKLRRLITMISLKEDSPITPVEFEIRFHETLAMISNNRFAIALSLLYGPLFEYHSANLIPYESAEVMPDFVITDHQDIVNALEKKDTTSLVEALKRQMYAKLQQTKDAE